MTDGPIKDCVDSLMIQFVLIATSSVPNANVLTQPQHYLYGHNRWNEECHVFPSIRFVPTQVQFGQSDISRPVSRIGTIGQQAQYRSTSQLQCQIWATDELTIWTIFKTLMQAIRQTNGLDKHGQRYSHRDPNETVLNIFPNDRSNNTVNVHGLIGQFQLELDFFDSANPTLGSITLYSASLATNISGSYNVNKIITLDSGSL